MRKLILLCLFTLAACGDNFNPPPSDDDGLEPDSGSELADAGIPDGAIRPDAEPRPECSEVADQCPSAQWNCTVCGPGQPSICTCNDDATVVCTISCEPPPDGGM